MGAGDDEYFSLTPDDIANICSFDKRSDPEQVTNLKDNHGGASGIARALRSDAERGLNTNKSAIPISIVTTRSPIGSSMSGNVPNVSNDDLEKRRSVFGENIIPPPRSESILEIVWGTIKDDPILQVLIVGAAVVLTTGTILCPSQGWTEGLAIFIAVFLVLTVTAGNDWSKDRKFKKLLLLQTDKKCRVVRNGKKAEISSWDLLVGDVIELIVGDEVPADGVFIKGNRLVIDESPLTGETQPQKKSDQAPFLFSGCQVTEGTGFMLVTAVGSRSSGGRIQELLNEAQNTQTVLQLKLKDVAIYIGKIGVGAGIVTFLGLMLRLAIDWANGASTHKGECGGTGGTTILHRILNIAENFVVAITIVVVAVPEGLPLAVTLSLSLSMFKMMRDKCFVRHLDASETMGQATTVCTDKTGTLTYNRMSVVRVLIGDKIYCGEGSGDKDAVPFSPETLPHAQKILLTDAACINSNCFIKNEDKLDQKNVQPVFVGSATEGALLMLSRKLGVSYKVVREKLRIAENGVWSFSAEKKRMSSMIHHLDGYRIYTKGASEVILSLCTHRIDPLTNGPTKMDDAAAEHIKETITAWASDGLRTLALAYRDTKERFEPQSEDEDPASKLVFIALVAIKDPIRKEIPMAVSSCQRAGLTVRMVTGDNILTATKIAKECNILFGDGIAIEGPTFRALPQEEKERMAPKLQVMARCSPNDKFELVSILKSQGEVVAVTGDGTNDAPALKEAHVGFSMGISGTQIAMNASDIVLLDDNFASIVQAIRWGRNVLNGIRKFIQFQLGINLAAIVFVFVGSVSYGESPLATVQLLWVNLIMDSFGALGLASEEPEDDILEYPPQRKSDPILTPIMLEYIYFQAFYQTTVILGILFGVDKFMPADMAFHTVEDMAGSPNVRTKSILFTTFIFMQIANMICARQLNGEISIFGGFFRNKLFLLMLTLIILVQTLVIIFGGSWIGTTRMDAREWILCVGISIIEIPFAFVFRVLMNVIRPYRKRSSGKVDVEAGGKYARMSAKDLDSPAGVPLLESRRSSSSIVEKLRKNRHDAPLPTKSQSSLNRN